MPTVIEAQAPNQLQAVNLSPRGAVNPSPIDWRDQILYFLLPDRFCDHRVANVPLFNRTNPQQFIAPSKSNWMSAGKTFQGGTIQGIRKQLNYLQGLGATALWIGPVFRQRQELLTPITAMRFRISWKSTIDLEAGRTFAI